MDYGFVRVAAMTPEIRVAKGERKGEKNKIVCKSQKNKNVKKIFK